MKKIGNESLRLNMVLNGTKGVATVLFPLIMFPYISRILGAESLGKYNFACSIISYFQLLADLGIATYAIREGAALREDSIKLKRFVDQVFSINILSTIMSYSLLFLLLVIVKKFHGYFLLMLMLSSQIIFKTIGIEWLYSIYENYAYITVRSIFFQIVSLILIFMCVHDSNDIIVYTLVTVLSSVGSNLLNFMHARTIIKVRLTRIIEWNKHMKPIAILFASAVTVTVYVSSDMTMLGFLCDDITVGIYSVSVKVYSTIKSVLGSILVVSIPRLSALYGSTDKREYTKTAIDIYKMLITFVMPAIVGMIILREPIVLVVSGDEYRRASSSLMLLCIALMFCMFAWFWGQCVLIPIKREAEVFKITVISAVINITLNIFLIPLWKENAAAFTTVLSEGISCIWCMYKGKCYTDIKGFGHTMLKVLLGCVGIIFIGTVLKGAVGNHIAYILIVICCSVTIYISIEYILKNEVICNMVNRKNKR